MSAAVQLTSLQMASSSQAAQDAAGRVNEKKGPARETEPPANLPVITMAFYRKHTEKLLRRYLYSSMLVGRSPSILGDPTARGWASSRPVHTFEDSVIFVLDVEKCLHQLGALDRLVLARLVLQQYTLEEAAVMMGLSVRAVQYQLALALDRLTELLMGAKLLSLPHS